MLIRKPSDVRSSEITDYRVYRDRRRFLREGAGWLGVGAAAWAVPGLIPARAASIPRQGKFGKLPESRFNTDESPTAYKAITTYNNFYEFGTGKSDPAEYAHRMPTRPWHVKVDGECDHPRTFDLNDFLGKAALEERIYRHRCVEAWSMVIPWVGVPLAAVLKRFGPNSRAKYVAFTTLYDPKDMPGQHSSVLDWPYREGLRIDEAMHPLTLLAVGVYGKVMPNQNGAPLRLVVPWKYGYKSIKSIVAVRFTEKQPVTSWHQAFPDRYGFYSNVNPDVDTVPWSQAYERRIGHFFKQKTRKFNGYGEQVAHLYQGMDLSKYY